MCEKQTNLPIVSVVMGVLYKRENLDLLKRSISSILDQTFFDFELIICDDGSTPEACLYLEECSKKDERIKLVRPGDKFDLASKLNACIRVAKGKYIARMDDDDYSLPERFAKQVEFLDKNLDVAFVGCNVALNKEGLIVGERILPEYPKVKDFYMTQPFVHPTLVFRREALEAVGGYSEDKRQFLCEDYDMLLRLYAKGYRGANIQEKLLEYTIPVKAKNNRKMSHRWNETVTRYKRFKELGVLVKAFPYVVKPLVVGLMPEFLLKAVKGR